MYYPFQNILILFKIQLQFRPVFVIFQKKEKRKEKYSVMKNDRFIHLHSIFGHLYLPCAGQQFTI